MKRLGRGDAIIRARLGLRRWRKSIRRQRIPKHGDRLVVISAPAVLSFSQNYRGTVDFLDSLRAAAQSGTLRRKLSVDLIPVKEISVPVAIVLAAEFHRWSLKEGRRLRPNKPRHWTPRLRSLLSDLGAFRLLGIDNVAQSGHIDSVTLTPLASGLKFDGEKIDHLQGLFADDLNSFTKNPDLYAGMHEAVENAIAHAYPNEYDFRHKPAGHRWWAASCLDLTSQNLRFFVFDQGAGIPYTLPRQTLSEEIRARLEELTAGLVKTDAHLLQAAVETRRSATQQSHRGLGLSRMAEVTQGHAGSYLRILSGRGEIRYQGRRVVVTKNHNTHLGGTLIEWSIPADVFQAEE